MERYESYKDSGVQWLGEIPSHWEILSLKHILKLRRITVGKQSNKYDLLSLTLQGIIKRDMENPTGKFPSSFDSYQVVNENDFVFCNFDNAETPRAVGLSPYHGMITGAYDVLYRFNNDLLDKYLIYYFLYIDDNKRFRPLYKGLRNTVPFDAFMSYKIPVPSCEEQNRIVAYLDVATSKIDEAIVQQQKMIDLLNERKQIIINNAVTKGLNPDAPMKNSGVDWIGDIPEHWELCKLKRVAKGFCNGTAITQIASGTTQYPVTRIETITTGKINYDKVGYVHKDISLSRYLLSENDILISNINSFERVGNCAIYDGKKELYHGMNLLRITPLNNIDPSFLLLSLKTSFYLAQMRKACKPAINQVSVPSSAVKNIFILLPPMNEQISIVNSCKKALDEITDSVELYKKQILLLQERKQIIINEVVTGKVKV